MTRVMLSTLFWMAMVTMVAAPMNAGASSYGAPGIPALDGRYLLKSGEPEIKVFSSGTTSLRIRQEAESNFQIRVNAGAGASQDDASKPSITLMLKAQPSDTRASIYILDPGATSWRKVWTVADSGAHVYRSSINIYAKNNVQNSLLWLRDEAGVSQGLFYWDRASNKVELRKYSGGFTSAWLTMTDTWLGFKGATIWNANNDGVSSGLDADKIDGLDITDAPVGGAAFVRVSEREELLGYDQNPAPAFTLGGSGPWNGTITPPAGVRAVRLRIETVINAAGAATSHRIRAYLTDSSYTNFYRLLAQADYKEFSSASITAGEELFHQVDSVVVPVGPDGAVHLRQGDDISQNATMQVYVDGYVR